MTPVVNSSVEIANRAVYWIGEGMRRKARGNKMLITDNTKTMMYGWKDLTERKEMRISYKDLHGQRLEVQQILGIDFWKKLKRIEGRREIFGASIE